MVCLAMMPVLLPAPAQAGKRAHHNAGAAAVAHEEIVACEAAYVGAQEREQSSHLVDAKTLWLRCARPSCGPFFQQACTASFARLEADMPSVVPVVTDEAGAPRTDVEVKMDGEPLTSRLDGHALLVDPGVHEFSFSAGGKAFATQRLMITEGQRNRLVSASLRAADQSDAPAVAPGVAPAVLSSEAPARAVPARELAAPEAMLESTGTGARGGHRTLAYVIGGVGAASVAGAALLTYWGRKDNRMLTQCSTPTPACPQSSVDHIKRLYLVSDVALGVGVVALGTAYWLYTASHAPPSPEKRSTDEAYRIDVQPTKAGAVASVSASF
jgi:hypothetical protein